MLTLKRFTPLNRNNAKNSVIQTGEPGQITITQNSALLSLHDIFLKKQNINMAEVEAYTMHGS